jgi:hypothetical protein
MARSDMEGSRRFWEECYSHWPLTDEEAANELHDWYVALHEVPKVYHELTGGRFTKPNTMAQYVIEAAREIEARDDDELRRYAAAWARLCAIDKERQVTHRRPMLPRGVMDEVNRIATGQE